ncbi:MAG: hypothetical protein JW852_05140 [Spirochaetales bacterium]|nr:hypothetical protein [Spirochaetales bacterium]
MFNPSLREHGKDKIVYSTSLAFRIVFLVMAVFILVSVISASDGPLLSRFNGISFFIILICLFAALYLERWIFDRKTNSFERNLGILFLYSKKRMPLDTLRKVVLFEPGMKYTDRPKYSRWMARKAALLAIVDEAGVFYKLDMVKGGAVGQGRRIAETLSMFCGIPLEDKTADISEDLM